MRRMKRWVVVSLSVVLAAVALSLLYAQQTTRAVSNPYETFDENEMERYRVDIEQVTPDTGIETGFVIAYGYYIIPPYRVYADTGVVYVNRVQIEPWLPLPPRQYLTDPWLDSESGKRAQMTKARLRLTREAAVGAWRAALRNGLTDSLAMLAAESAFVSDTLVDSIRRLDRYTIEYYGPEVELPGGLREVHREAVTLTPPEDNEYTAEERQANAVAMAEVIRASLVRGHCSVYTWGSVTVLGAGPVRQLVSAVGVAETDAEQRWRSLLTVCGSSAAYACVVNYEAARPTWEALAKRLAEGR